MERIVKVGIIGCGGIANGKHMPSLQKLPNVEMVAFCDIIVERACTYPPGSSECGLPPWCSVPLPDPAASDSSGSRRYSPA